MYDVVLPQVFSHKISRVRVSEAVKIVAFLMDGAQPVSTSSFAVVRSARDKVDLYLSDVSLERLRHWPVAATGAVSRGL